MTEGEFEFDFGTAKVDRPDKINPIPQGMQLVDFLIEESGRLIMLEVKDFPSTPKSNDPKAKKALEKSRDDFLEKIRTGRLIADELTPKARDSYTYLHLMRRDTRRILYVFLLGTENLTPEPSLLLGGFKERLEARLKQETDQPWVRPYVSDCLVLTEQTWSLAFPNYPLRRVS